MVNSILNLIENPQRDFIYSIIHKQDLCVDVGAAAGLITRQLKLAGSEKTKVIAFEPFPGNHEYFINRTKDLNNIKLIKKAVSDRVGNAEFIVPSTVQGTEPGWEKFTGYSSVGFLSDSSTILEKIKKTAKSLLKKSLSITVRTTTLDEEFPTEDIDFLKIDIQGGELQALMGATNILKSHRVKILYIEWSGETEIVNLLENFGYIIYDSTYIGCPKNNDISQFEKVGFTVRGSVKLSTGKIAYSMLLPREVSSCKVLAKIKQQKLGWVQTDLIAIRPETLESFQKLLLKNMPLHN